MARHDELVHAAAHRSDLDLGRVLGRRHANRIEQSEPIEQLGVTKYADRVHDNVTNPLETLDTQSCSRHGHGLIGVPFGRYRRRRHLRQRLANLLFRADP